MPTKPLPARPDLEQLKRQAKELLAAHRAATAAAAQRIREFHPRFRAAEDAAIAAAAFSLSDAQLAIAREYGFPSWPQLKHFIEAPARDDLDAPKHERIKDDAFRHAVDLLDAGNARELRAWLHTHPHLARTRVSIPGSNYFTNPALLDFVAENPTRRGTLPPTIVDVARVILDAGGREDQQSLDDTISLIASSAVAHACGVQLDLIRLLSSYGADPNHAAHVAALYAMFDAVELLLACGAALDLPLAAALGRTDDVRALAGSADETSRDLALSLASNHDRYDIVNILLDHGANINRYSPVGSHSHATPLHQAVASNRERIVRLLVDRGADLSIRDLRNDGTPLDWAEYLGYDAIAEYVRNSRGRGVDVSPHDAGER